MAQVQCQIEIPKELAETQGLTVGSLFYLNCDGEWPALNKESSEIRLDQADQYKLKLLNIEWPSKTSAKLTVTSYQPGQHHLKAVQVVDHETSVVLGDLDFTVNSVINPQEPPKEPYGPVGPLSLSLSILYPLAIVLFIGALAGFFFNRWRLRQQKKKLLADMRLNENVQKPYFQFYQTLRKLQRNFSYTSGAVPTSEEIKEFVESLGKAYKFYLARVFEIPTFAWNERKILSDLKRNHPQFYSESRLEVRKALAEIARAQKSLGQMTGADCQQLLELLRKNVDQIEQAVKGEEK